MGNSWLIVGFSYWFAWTFIFNMNTFHPDALIHTWSHILAYTCHSEICLQDKNAYSHGFLTISRKSFVFWSQRTSFRLRSQRDFRGRGVIQGFFPLQNLSFPLWKREGLTWCRSGMQPARVSKWGNPEVESNTRAKSLLSLSLSISISRFLYSVDSQA